MHKNSHFSVSLFYSGGFQMALLAPCNHGPLATDDWTYVDT